MVLAMTEQDLVPCPHSVYAFSGGPNKGCHICHVRRDHGLVPAAMVVEYELLGLGKSKQGITVNGWIQKVADLRKRHGL